LMTCLVLLAVASMAATEPDTTITTMDTLPIGHNPTTSSHLLPASHGVFNPTTYNSIFNPTMHNRGIFNPTVHNRGIFNPLTYNRGIFNPTTHNRGILNPLTYNRGIFNPLTYNRGIFNPTTHNRGIFNPTQHSPFMHPMNPPPHHLTYKMNPKNYRTQPFLAMAHQSFRPMVTSTTNAHAVSKREAEPSTSTTLAMPSVSTHPMLNTVVPSTYSSQHLVQPPHHTIHGAIASTAHSNLPFTQAIRPIAHTNLPYAHSNNPFAKNTMPYAHNNFPYSHSNIPYSHSNIPYSHSTIPYSHSTIPYAHSNIHLRHGMLPYTRGIYGNLPFTQGTQGICRNHLGMRVSC